ncbi:hypothetical protein [Rheinheimera sp.]|uniref:hypothetical protein n=1 Tax=Rheinheimera sp. TaxID=1869214 RepID=UPI00307CDD0C
MNKHLLFSLALLSFSSLADDQIGLSIGTPAAINFVYKGEIADLPLQLSGGYWGDAARGIELGYRFMEQDSAFSSAQFLVGYSRTEDRHDEVDEWSYVGVSATFTYKGFYLEPGLSIGTGDYSNPQLLLQAGYMWSF